MVGVNHNVIKPKKLAPLRPSFALVPENLKSTHKPAVNRLVILLVPPSTFGTASIPRLSAAVAPDDVVAVFGSAGADGRLQPLNGVDPSQPPSGCGRGAGPPWMVTLLAVSRRNELLAGVTRLPGRAVSPLRACAWAAIVTPPRTNDRIVRGGVPVAGTFETVFTCP